MQSAGLPTGIKTRSSMPETPANKSRSYRARKAGRLTPLPTCPTCGRRITGAGRDGLCSRCWAITPAGREDLRLRVQRLRQRRAAAE
jgi:hypothetical protein